MVVDEEIYGSRMTGATTTTTKNSLAAKFYVELFAFV
jgi:hypothetical protein